MGCANAKPEVHTKKPSLNSNTNINPSQVSKPIQYPTNNYQPIPIGKENIVPLQQDQNFNVQNQKSNLTDIQKNPYLTRQQVKQQLVTQQQQLKNPYKAIPVKEVPHQKQNTHNDQPQRIGYPKKQKSFQIKPFTVPLQQNKTPQRQNIVRYDEKNHVLSTIKQGGQQSEFTKQVQPSFLGLERREDLRISTSILSSGTPRMDQNCMVSNIFKPTESPSKPRTEEQKVIGQSDVKTAPKVQFMSEQLVQKQSYPIATKDLSEILYKKTQNEELKLSHFHENNTPNKFDKKQGHNTSAFGKQSNQITSDEIKINVLSNKKSQQHNLGNEDELFIPTEQNFDLGCSFQINNLIIDMNKVVW